MKKVLRKARLLVLLLITTTLLTSLPDSIFANEEPMVMEEAVESTPIETGAGDSTSVETVTDGNDSIDTDAAETGTDATASTVPGSIDTSVPETGNVPDTAPTVPETGDGETAIPDIIPPTVSDNTAEGTIPVEPLPQIPPTEEVSVSGNTVSGNTVSENVVPVDTVSANEINKVTEYQILFRVKQEEGSFDTQKVSSEKLITENGYAGMVVTATQKIREDNTAETVWSDEVPVLISADTKRVPAYYWKNVETGDCLTSEEVRKDEGTENKVYEAVFAAALCTCDAGNGAEFELHSEDCQYVYDSYLYTQDDVAVMASLTRVILYANGGTFPNGSTEKDGGYPFFCLTG